MLYKGPGLLAVVWFGSSLTSSPVNMLSLYLLLTGERGRRGRRIRIIRRRESPVFYKSFNTLWCNQSVYLSPLWASHCMFLACYYFTICSRCYETVTVLSDIAIVVAACVLCDIRWGYRTHSTVLSFFIWGFPLTYLILQDWKVRHHEYNQTSDNRTYEYVAKPSSLVQYLLYDI
jgi:hypothetical protein